MPRLLAHPGFELVAAVEPDPKTVARAAGLVGDMPVYPDLAQLPAAEVDLAFILVPNHAHAAVSRPFLRQGRAVFLEKPASTDRGQLDALAEAVRAGGGRLVLSSAARYRTDVSALRELVRAGVLGRPRLAELSWVRSRGIPPSAWFRSRAQSGGGVLIDLGWHVIDVVRDLWGAAPVQAALAVPGADFLRRGGWEASWQGHGPPPGEADVEDQLTGLVRTEGYAMTLRFGCASHEEADLTAISLHGTDGLAVLRTTFGFSPCRSSGPSLVLKRGGRREEVPIRAAGVGAEYDAQLDAIAGLVGDGEATDQALADAYDLLGIVDACYRSAGLS